MITTNPIVVKADFANYVHLPTNFRYDETMKPRVLQAQQHDLRKLVGKEFYAEIAQVLDNSGTVPGGLTTLTQTAYDNIVPYIKPVVIHFAYARFINQQDEHNTNYGTVVKKNPHSEPISEKRRTTRTVAERSKAVDYWQDMLEYMEDNTGDYPTWRDNKPKESEKGTMSINFSSV